MTKPVDIITFSILSNFLQNFELPYFFLKTFFFLERQLISFEL